MSINDFESVWKVLAPDFVLEWSQSKGRIRGAEHFARMNAEYLAHGPWRFTINRLVGGETEAVTVVSVTDGTQAARAISFFFVTNGKVDQFVEFWPEPYPAPTNRSYLTGISESFAAFEDGTVVDADTVDTGRVGAYGQHVIFGSP